MEASLFFSLKYAETRDFASTTVFGSCVYGLKVLIRTYSNFGPTVSAVLLGSVHGVVVQARMKTSPNGSVKRNSLFSSSFTLNMATAVVSFIGL